jgi:Fe-S oxidoreductase
MIDNKIAINNAKEEIKEIVAPCNTCGLCKALDPHFRVERDEPLSPRGRAILFSQSKFDKSLFDLPLSGICKETCPLNIDIDQATRKARKILNLRGKSLKDNKEILKKIENNENPFS